MAVFAIKDILDETLKRILAVVNPKRSSSLALPFGARWGPTVTSTSLSLYLPACTVERRRKRFTGT